MTSSLRAKTLTFSLGVCALGIIFGAVEITMRATIALSDQFRLRYAFSDELLNEIIPKTNARAWPRLTLLTSTPKPTHLPPNFVTPVTLIETGNFAVNSSDTGFSGAPNGQGTAKLVDSNNATIYSVKIQNDRDGFRVLDIANPERAPALFLGCSITWGEGVEAEQTFGAVFGREQKQFQPHLYAFRGWGPGNVLRLTRRPTFGGGKKVKTGIAIYTYIDHHLARVTGSSSMTGQHSRWLWAMPSYREGPAGLIDEGFFQPAHPLLTAFYSAYQRVVINSALLGSVLPQLPIFNAADVDLTISILDEIRRNIESKTGISRFYVAIYPGSFTARWLVPRLKARGIAVLDYSKFPIDEFASPSRIPFDGHPTPAAQEAYGKLLARDLAE
ncbi:hypothetical protein BH10BDE1_BH10BDE1_01720 [soil metagenome]